VRALTTVDRADIDAETIFLSVYARFFVAAPRAPALLESTSAIPTLVASAERFSRGFSMAQSRFLCVGAQNREFAEFMIKENVWWLILRIIRLRNGAGIVMAARAALCLAEIDPERFVAEERDGVRLFEAISIVGAELPFSAKTLVAAAVLVVIRDIAETSLAEIWACDACLSFVVGAIVAEPDEFVDLRFEAVLRLFEACAIDEERLVRLQEVADETFMEWLPGLAADERVQPELAAVIQRLCERFDVEK
jgi:hypothetical protein